MIGIDAEILRITPEIEKLFEPGGIFEGVTYDINGRAYIENVSPDIAGVRPYVFKGGKRNDYIEVMQNDKVAFTSFFRLLNPQDIQTGNATANMELFVFCNLKKLFPNADYRADEDLLITITNALLLTPADVLGEVVRGFDAISEFEVSNTGRQTMHPYFVCKIGLSINYQNC